MKNELIETLTNVTNVELIRKLILNMNNRDISILMSLLEHTSEDTQRRWLDSYNQLTKY